MTSIFKYSLNKNLDHINTLVNLLNNLRPVNNSGSVEIEDKNDHISNVHLESVKTSKNVETEIVVSEGNGNTDIHLVSERNLDDSELYLNCNAIALKAISELCSGIFSKAISLLDNGAINIYIEANTNRRFYLVENKDRTKELSYLVMRHFCSCRSYIDKVVIRKKEFTCKHELACSIIDSIYLSNTNDSNYNFPILNNKLIKIIVLNECEYSEKYLHYISNFFIENETFKKYT